MLDVTLVGSVGNFILVRHMATNEKGKVRHMATLICTIAKSQVYKMGISCNK